jgi:hypothetical protein
MSGGGVGGMAGRSNGGDAGQLPIDLPNTPVTGSFTVASDASWEVEGTFVPTHQILTPTANYWLVHSLGAIVSLTDKASPGQQWIDFSSGFRPLRSLPSFATSAPPNR